jgi:CheY-like chemotaxis protein
MERHIAARLIASSTPRIEPESRIAMIVEDEWLLREQIAEDLRQEGWQVVEASSGEQALSYVGAGRQLDLLITDIGLAGALDGWDVAQSCRSAMPDLAVIYTTANARDTSRVVAGSLFLGKPVRIAALLEICRSLLSH